MQPAHKLSKAEAAPESGERRKDWDPGPYSNEPEMEGYLHLMAFFTLLASLRWFWRDRKDWFAAGNLSIYYRVLSPRTGRLVRKKLAFRGPDFFLVLGTDPTLPRNSWVVENEGKFPDFILEILSKSTQKKDRGEKKTIYEKIFKTPEYFLFDPDKLTLEGFRLSRGRYVAIKADAQGRVWSERLGLALGAHEGTLRLFMADGALVPLPDEAALKAMTEQEREATRAEQQRAQAEQQRAQAEQQRAQAEQQRARAERAEQDRERLAAKLRALGIDPDAL